MNLFAVGTAFLLGLYLPVGTVMSLGLQAAKLPWWPEGHGVAALLAQLLVYALDFGIAVLFVRWGDRRFGSKVNLPPRFPGQGAIVAGLGLCGAYMLLQFTALVVSLEHAPTFVFIAAALAVPLSTLLVGGGMLRAVWSVRRGRGRTSISPTLLVVPGRCCGHFCGWPAHPSMWRARVSRIRRRHYNYTFFG